MCASGEAAHAASTWGGLSFTFALPSFSYYLSYGTYLFPGILPFTPVGRSGGQGGRVELSAKVAPSASFTVEGKKVKAGLSRELSRAIPP